jgi:hypothetical protein
VSGPDFHELIGGDDLSPEESARLLRVHELLVEAGPPAELPPSLAAAPPDPGAATVSRLPRRRRGALLLIAAAIAAIAFGGGYLLGHRNTGFSSERAIPMHSTRGTSAEASLQFASRDTDGNWPIRMVVTGLPNLGKNGYYELFLTRGKQQLASCGTFVVAGRTTVVQLNAPYLLPKGAGWIVVAHLRKHRVSADVLTT